MRRIHPGPWGPFRRAHRRFIGPPSYSRLFCSCASFFDLSRSDMIVCEILKIGKQGRVIEVTSSPHLQRGKHLVYQRSHRKRHPILASSFQDKTEVLMVKAYTTPRSKIMGKHTRSTKFHH